IAPPGIAAGALLAFALSFHDFIITNFNDVSTVTFPMFVWGFVHRGTPVQINVIGTAMFVVAVLLVLLSMADAYRRTAPKAYPRHRRQQDHRTTRRELTGWPQPP